MEDLDPRLRGNGNPPDEDEASHHRHGQSRLQRSDVSDASIPGLGTSSQSQQQQQLQQQSVGTVLSDDNAAGAKISSSSVASSSSAAAAAAAEEEAKKARACEACRGLKVKCEPDPDDETHPCKRCKKAGRSCVVTAPSRKRQKKTDSRVADLEKKIDALTATLQARSSVAAGHQVTGSAHGHGHGHGHGTHSIVEEDATDTTRTNAQPWGGVPPAKAWHSPSMAPHQDRDKQSSSAGVARRASSLATAPPNVAAGQKRKDRDSVGSPDQISERTRQAYSQPTPVSYKSRNPEFVERGLITMEQADQLLRKYNERMLPHFPAIIVPPGTTAAELNRTRPVLFASIMAAATTGQPVLQKTLQRELMICFAERVFLAGEKSLDTVQAILVAVIWYWPPENFEELKFYQLIHTASVMAIDIGLGRRGGSRRAEPPFGLRDPASKKPAPPDALTLECRRTWLACYLLGTNAAMALHRPVLIRWSSFMAESAELLEKSPDALPSDRALAQLVWAHKLSEETGVHFFSEDPDVRINLADPPTQFLLRGLERELDRRRTALPREKRTATVSMTFHTVNLFMHELVLNSSAASDQGRAPFSTESLTVNMIGSDSPLSAAQISSLSACLVSIHGVCDIFLSIPIDSARCLPVYFFVRVAYALVILIKMAFSASKPGSELGRIAGPDDIRVQYYLDALVGKFRELSMDDQCRPAAKFLIVLAMLRTWVMRQVKDGTFSVSSKSSEPLQAARHKQPEDPKLISPPLPPPPPPPPPPHSTHRSSPSQQPASTPLHLLSEVASNRNNSTSAGAGVGGGSAGVPPSALATSQFFNGISRVPQPFFADGSATTAAAAAPDSTSSTASAGSAATGGADMNMNAWMPGSMGFAPPTMPLDPSIMNGSLDLEGVDLATAEPWFTDVFNVMPNMENMFYF